MASGLHKMDGCKTTSWPCLLCLMCLKDTCTLEEKKLRDPRRLYAPGRLYHIVERKPLRFGRFPPVVRTALPVDGRFDHIVLSCNATSDHAILWIERESKWALDLMLEKNRYIENPAEQKMERHESLRGQLLWIFPKHIHLVEMDDGEDSARSSGKDSSLSHKKRRDSWNEFVGCMFDVDDAGHMVFKNTTP